MTSMAEFITFPAVAVAAAIAWFGKSAWENTQMSLSMESSLLDRHSRGTYKSTGEISDMQIDPNNTRFQDFNPVVRDEEGPFGVRRQVRVYRGTNVEVPVTDLGFTNY